MVGVWLVQCLIWLKTESEISGRFESEMEVLNMCEPEAIVWL